jgi:hypothetical protein
MYVSRHGEEQMTSSCCSQSGGLGDPVSRSHHDRRPIQVVETKLRLVRRYRSHHAASFGHFLDIPYKI